MLSASANGSAAVLREILTLVDRQPLVALFALLSAVWWFAVDRWLRLPNPEEALRGAVGRPQE